jgi:lipopolysaccharide transport system ATP-binding protein
LSAVIKVENLSKQYRLGDVGTGTISHDVNRWWHKIRGKEDPYLKIGDSNDRTTKAESDYVWALKDINFEVQQGEVLGIIGRNGAGKSTLLKILSRTTAPTTGSIKIKGRVASLLEVGTGFHPDLSARDNIFLNGAILGMTRREIQSKFDEIVDFAGVERYIDTPVKRYSSGMYVRLAFAVAAHLDPEILIVDEVLAVGDAEFQKKCLGKMKDVSVNQGRTVLFVSHQMDAIYRLCEKVLLMEIGKKNHISTVEEGISRYLSDKRFLLPEFEWKENYPGDEFVILKRASVKSHGALVEKINIKSTILIEFEYEILKIGLQFVPSINVFNDRGDYLFTSHDVDRANSGSISEKRIYNSQVEIPSNLLAEGKINISIAMVSYDPYIVHFHETNKLSILIIDDFDGNSARGFFMGAFPGLLRPKLNWALIEK